MHIFIMFTTTVTVLSFISIDSLVNEELHLEVMMDR